MSAALCLFKEKAYGNQASDRPALCRLHTYGYVILRDEWQGTSEG